LRLKTTFLPARLLCLAAVLLVVAACDDKKTDDTISSTPTKLRVEEIIVSPKATVPGDTVLLTADIRSSSQNVGDIPSTTWTADGGTFVEDNKLTVRWVAPATTGFYTVTVKATNAAGTVTSQANLFVGLQAQLVSNQAGAITLRQNGTDFYYLRSPDITAGVEAFKYEGGVSSDAISPVRPTGFELVYDRNLAFEVHASTVTAPESLAIASANPRPRQIYVGDFTLGTLQRISTDLAPFDSGRRNQYGYPTISPDGQIIAFQGVVTNVFSASLDSVDIFVYWPGTPPTRVRATFTHTNHKNFYPSFSVDQNWLTFISDRGGSNQWEIYGMPVSGTSVNTAQASLVRLTDTGGTIAATRPGGVPGFPLRAWNPVSSTLAMVSGDNILYLMTTNGSGATLLDVSGLPVSIQELKWSPDGTQLAVAATGKNAADQSVAQIYLVAGTTADLRLEALPGDVVRDIAFSPDAQWMVFRVARGGQAWLEIMDMSGGTLSQTVPLTGTYPAGDAANYRPVMSLSPAWGAGDILYAPVFMGSSTPGIMTVDVSGAIQ
jgi:Tol biopolymer transport system component